MQVYVFTHSLTFPDVSLCHSRFSLSVIPAFLPLSFLFFSLCHSCFSLSVIPDIFNRESRGFLFQGGSA